MDEGLNAVAAENSSNTVNVPNAVNAPIALNQTDFDIAIVGGGPVGMALAGWLVDSWPILASRIAVFDTRSLEQSMKDARILALSEATRLRLSGLGFVNNATPIHRIHVSEQGCFGQVRMQASDLGVRALGWTVRYGDLVASLNAALVRRGVSVFRSCAVQAHEGNPQQLVLKDGRQYTVALKVDAEGGLFGQTATRDAQVDYDQHALVCEVQLSVDSWLKRERQTIAFERFTSEGPAALLPISQDGLHYGLVWCGSPMQVQQRVAAPSTQFLQELQQVFGNRVLVQSHSQRVAFPLGMSWQTQLVNGNRVMIGNAAQILHPVAGQGLNLGLRDAQALCAVLNPQILQSRSELSLALSQFEANRQTDRKAVMWVTDGMVRGFSSAQPWVQWGRRLGLNLMESTPWLRDQFADLMLFGLPFFEA